MPKAKQAHEGSFHKKLYNYTIVAAHFWCLKAIYVHLLLYVYTQNDS